MKIYEAWAELREWLESQDRYLGSREVLDKIDELECKYELKRIKERP